MIKTRRCKSRRSDWIAVVDSVVDSPCKALQREFMMIFCMVQTGNDLIAIATDPWKTLKLDPRQEER